MNSTPPPSSTAAHSAAQDGNDDFLQQAQAAVQRGDWAIATQCLYQSVLQLDGAEAALASTPSALSHDLESDLDTLQVLAFQVLEFGDFQDRWDVAKVFSALGVLLAKTTASVQILPDGRAANQLESLISPLIAYLNDDDPDPEMQWFVTRILSEFRQSDVLMALVDLLKTSATEDLREMAATALVEFGGTAVPALTNLLAFDRTRLLAVKTLAQIREPECVEPLMQMVHDADPAIRAAAIAAIGSNRDPRIPYLHIPDLLVEALQDPAAAVRQIVVTDLGFRADLLPHMDLVGLIQPLLKDENFAVCQQTAIALSRLGTPAATVALADAAQIAQTPLQLECIRALGWMNTPTALAALHHVLDQTLATWATSQVSVLATPDLASTDLAPTDLAPVNTVLELTKALGCTKSPELRHQATAYLIACLQSCPTDLQTSEIKQAIALELGNLADPAALDPLLQLAIDPELSVKLHAIAALKHLNPTQAHQCLTAWVTDGSASDAIRQEAAIALQEWG